MLALNKPCIAFWENSLDHLLPDAKPLYEELVDAGIIYFNPELAANFINKVWEEIPAWWSTEKVQIARGNFIQKYSKVSGKPVEDLYQLLVSK